jgi:hypothetical protein
MGKLSFDGDRHRYFIQSTDSCMPSTDPLDRPYNRKIWRLRELPSLPKRIVERFC